MPEYSAPSRARVALVTGAAQRIGAAVVRRLHAEGFGVALHYRHSEEPAERLAAELNALRPDSVCTYSAELLDVAALPALVEAVLADFGRLDCLVNNASSFYPTPVGTITAEHWEDLVGTNLRAPLFLTQAAAAHLRAARGSVVNVADVHGRRPLKGHPVYCAAKAGLVMLTRALARELGPEVRVNAVAPGAILWPAAELGPAAKADIVDRTALKRHGEPEDVAGAVLFLVRDAPYVTGEILHVDGGRLLAD